MTRLESIFLIHHTHTHTHRQTHLLCTAWSRSRQLLGWVEFRQLTLPVCLIEQPVVEGDMLAMMQVKNPVLPAKLCPQNSGNLSTYAPLELYEKDEYEESN